MLFVEKKVSVIIDDAKEVYRFTKHFGTVYLKNLKQLFQSIIVRVVFITVELNKVSLRNYSTDYNKMVAATQGVTGDKKSQLVFLVVRSNFKKDHTSV